MTQPEVSVVIPCFNAQDYIATTLRSVLGQQGVDLEVVVVDDGSRDASALLVQDLFPQVRLIRQANAGVAAARNAGIAAARGRWIAFVDADDVWLPGKLAAQRAALEQHPGVKFSYCGWHVWPAASVAPEEEFVATLASAAPGPDSISWIYPELLQDCVVWTSTVVADRELLVDLGGFDTARRIGEDYSLWLRASRVTPFLRVDRVGALYRMHPNSITKGAPAKNDKAEVIAQAIERWGYAGPDGRTADRKRVARSLARSWADFAGAHLMSGSTAAALPAAWRSVRIRPWQTLAWKVMLKGMVAAVGLTPHGRR